MFHPGAMPVPQSSVQDEEGLPRRGHRVLQQVLLEMVVLGGRVEGEQKGGARHESGV